MIDPCPIMCLDKHVCFHYALFINGDRSNSGSGSGDGGGVVMVVGGSGCGSSSAEYSNSSISIGIITFSSNLSVFFILLIAVWHGVSHKNVI